MWAFSQRVQAESFGLFGREDEGHVRDALARFAAHRDVCTTVRASPEFALLGTGSEEPQSGQVRPFSRAIRVSRRFRRSVSHLFLAMLPVYPTPTHGCSLLSYSPECVVGGYCAKSTKFWAEAQRAGASALAL